jgi:hypothetical protein
MMDDPQSKTYDASLDQNLFDCTSYKDFSSVILAY